jgi:hypothetical protein
MRASFFGLILVGPPAQAGHDMKRSEQAELNYGDERSTPHDLKELMLLASILAVIDKHNRNGVVKFRGCWSGCEYTTLKATSWSFSNGAQYLFRDIVALFQASNQNGATILTMRPAYAFLMVVSLILLFAAVATPFAHHFHGPASPPATDKRLFPLKNYSFSASSSSSERPDLSWATNTSTTGFKYPQLTFKVVGTDQKTGLPLNEISLALDDRLYYAGKFDGYCSRVATSMLTTQNEIDAIDCSFTESGTVIGFFAEAHEWIVKARDWNVSELGPETPSGDNSPSYGATSFRPILTVPRAPQ